MKDFDWTFEPIHFSIDSVTRIAMMPFPVCISEDNMRNEYTKKKNSGEWIALHVIFVASYSALIIAMNYDL